MTRLTDFFMKRPVLFWSFMAMLLVAGVISFTAMPKLEDPAVSLKQATVVVAWPGADAHEIELKVARMMEDELQSLPDIDKIKTECKRGSAVITVEFKMTVLETEQEQYFDLLRRKVNNAAAYLPQGCYSPVVIDDMMDVYGIFYALTAEGYDYPELYKYAQYIRRELLAIDGVKRINIFGNRDEVINITLSKEQIARNGVMPTQIMSALQDACKTVNAGSFLSDDDRIAVFVDEDIRDEEDVKNLLISTLDNKQLRIGDIAKVERTFDEPQRNGFYLEGQPALAICVALEASSIVPDVGAEVDARLNEVLENIPAGFKTEKIFFQPDKVSEAINSFLVNLLESVAIVIILLIFTMGFRSGLIIGFGLVMTIAASFPVLLTLDTTLQRISLGAFIIAMGMLVDNSVVIMDGILVDRQKGLPPRKYLRRIVNNTAMPLLGATIIAASTFLCVYLSPDSAGEYAHDLFLVLCVSLVISWLLAIIQVPICAKSWLPIRDKKHSKADKKPPVTERFVRKAIGVLIERKAVTVVIAVALLVLSAFGMTKVKNLFFPDFEYKQFVVECFFPSATDASTVRDRMIEMSNMLSENPAIERVAMSQGSAPAHYCLVRPMTSGGDCYGELFADCKDYATVMEQIPTVRKQLREAFPEAYIRIRKYNFSISTSHTVEVEFAGPDPAVLRSLSAQAEEIMRQCPYVDELSVQNNWKPTGKAITAQFSRQDALRSGIGRGDVANALAAATDGMAIGLINDQDRMVTIKLQVRNADGSRISNLDEIPVWSTMNLHASDEDLQKIVSGGDAMSQLQDKVFSAMPLSNVTSDISLGTNEDVVYRLNGQRVIEAECDPNADIDEATPAKVVSAIEDQIEAIPLPDGYSMRWVGEGEVQGEAIGNLMKYVPVTVIIILLVLLMLFNSWKKLALILLCFPFVICGIVPVLLITGQPMTFMSIIGSLGLMGMMIKNAIVLVDEINRLQREEKMPAYRAVVEATVSRTRPVVMASMTTVFGMIPLITDPMYGSMALSIVGGLTVGTVITLVLLPIFYTAMFHIRKS